MRARRGGGVPWGSGVLIVVALMWASVGVAGPKTDAGDLRAEAAAALNAGDTDAALAALSTLARLEGDPSVWTLVGDLALRVEQAEDAVTAWGHALAKRPDDAVLLDRIARVSAELGDWSRASEAEADLVRLLAQRAKSEPGAEHLDLLTGRHEPVALVYRRHLSVLSELAVLAGDFTTAEEAARALTRAYPKATDGALALGYVYLQAGEYDQAVEAYEAVLALEPSHPIALNNLGTVEYMARNLDGAAAGFEAVLESPASNAYAESIALANLGELAQLRDQIEDAEYLYRQAIEVLPRGAWSYMGLASLLDMIGDYDAAVDAMIDGWERDANHLTRLNMHFFQPEWGWQRDALIAEIEGDLETAHALWMAIAEGQVKALMPSARHHLSSLRLQLEK